MSLDVARLAFEENGGSVAVRTLEDGRRALHVEVGGGEAVMLSFDDVLADQGLRVADTGLDSKVLLRMQRADHNHAVNIGYGWQPAPREARALALNLNTARDYRPTRYLDGSGKWLGSDRKFERDAQGEWLWARYRIAPGTTKLEYRVWFDGDPEPDTWLSASGMNQPLNDHVGLWFHSATTSQAVDVDIAWFSTVLHGAEHPHYQEPTQ
jgi:hypothetical protein